METSAPDVTNSVFISSPRPTPTLSPAGPPEVPPYFPFITPIPTAPAYIPPIELGPKRFVGKPLVIYGYGPANAKVGLNGIGVSESTTSDRTGYFVFTRVYSYSSVYPELCLQAVDIENRVTQPSCIPGLPESADMPSAVGPVLLSPTISVDYNNVLVGDEVKAQGYTIPNSSMDIFMYRENKAQLSLVNEAYAYTIPKYQIESDDRGEFEFSLPTQSAVSYKLYASSIYGDNPSTKSNTLTFSVLTEAQSGYRYIKQSFFGNNLVWFVLLEIILVIFLVRAILKPASRADRPISKPRKHGKKKMKLF
ncbi:hypothetical protein ISR94_02930 [Candidatus Microgenomates bacterium]|nr:hypothetical protein [Candidatus Microgenomates bacterium]